MIDTITAHSGSPTAQYETVTGQIDTVIYENSPFLIAKLKDGTIVKGSMSSPQRGCVYTLDGRWESHPQYGRQFSFVDYELDLPQDEEAIRDYLRENAPGVGPLKSRDIVKRFGQESLTICRDDPERLAREIDSISEEAARRISESLRKIADSAALEISLKEIFAGSRITRRTIESVKDAWGADAPARIRTNPFQLIDDEDIPGVGFVTADQIARNCGYTMDGSPRIRAGIIYALNEAAQSAGHVCMIRRVLIREAIDLLGLSADHIENVIPEMVEQEDIVSVQIDGEEYVYAKHLFEDERQIARRIARLLKHHIDPVEPDGAGLHEDQQLALRNALRSPVSIITGAPGTGKTHTIRKIVESLPGRHVALAAPTGKAAKRISELVGKYAQTIHRLLEPQTDGGNWSFARGFGNPIEADAIVLDEVSMVDTRLMARFIEAVDLGTRLILVGDIHQLPSVGPGNVLGELIESGMVPFAELTKIKRQDPGLIVINCHRIKDGMAPELPEGAKDEAGNDRDFIFVQRDNPVSIQQAISDLVCDRIPGSLGFNALSEIQVLSPVKTSTDLSCTALNDVLRDRLNPGETRGRFRVGDKVIQMKNDYDNDIVNGDIGYVEAMGRDELIVRFENPDRHVTLPLKNNDLQLAYALTVHKYQGSECPVVVIPVHSSLSHLVCQRNWIYTAISRAQKLCILVGQRDEVGKIVRRNSHERRLTNLRLMFAEGGGAK